MEKKIDNPLSRFDRQKTNYPLIAATVVLFGVLVLGIVLSARVDNLIGSGLFLAGVGTRLLQRVSSDAHAQVQFDVVLLAVGISVAVGFVFGLYPAIRAARLSPIDALRYE